MTTHVIYNEPTLQACIGELREAYRLHRFVRVTMKTGKPRSVDQNAISHAWYEQLARELREEDAKGWKRFCKLHLGIPILRAEDEEFRAQYDKVVRPLPYEHKLEIMDWFPVTSLMTVAQLSAYLVAMQEHFAAMHDVYLTFPQELINEDGMRQ